MISFIMPKSQTDKDIVLTPSLDIDGDGDLVLSLVTQEGKSVKVVAIQEEGLLHRFSLSEKEARIIGIKRLSDSEFSVIKLNDE